MFRKLAIAVAAAVTLGAGMAAAPAPASAQGFGLYFGGPGYGYGGYHRRHYGYGPGFYPGRRYYGPPVRRRCEEIVVRKKIRGQWRRVVETQCYPRRRYY